MFILFVYHTHIECKLQRVRNTYSMFLNVLFLLFVFLVATTAYLVIKRANRFIVWYLSPWWTWTRFYPTEQNNVANQSYIQISSFVAYQTLLPGSPHLVQTGLQPASLFISACCQCGCFSDDWWDTLFKPLFLIVRASRPGESYVDRIIFFYLLDIYGMCSC